MQLSKILAVVSLAKPILGSPFASQGPAKGLSRQEWAANNIQKKSLPSCSHDNLFRIFLDARYSSSASAFCSVYIESTSIVHSATTSTTVLSSTISTVVATITDVISSTEIDVITTTITDATDNVYEKRAAPTPPGQAGTYPPSRLSSACSCLVTPATVQTITVSTGAPVTSTEIAAIPLTTFTSTTTFQTLASTTTAHATASSIISWCAQPTVVAQSDHAIFAVTCGTSYSNRPSGYFATTPSVDQCFDICDADEACAEFTFEKGVSINNCYLVSVINSGDGVPDAMAQSGRFTGQFNN